MSASFEDIDLDLYEEDKDYLGSDFQKAVHESFFDGFYTNISSDRQRFEKFIAVARHNVEGTSYGPLPNERFLGRNLLYLAWQSSKAELKELHSRIQSNIDALAVHEGNEIVVQKVDFLAVDSDEGTHQTSFFYGECLGQTSVEIKSQQGSKIGPLADLWCVYGGISAVIRGNYFVGTDEIGFRKVGLLRQTRNVRLNSVTAVAHASLFENEHISGNQIRYHKPFLPTFHHSEVKFDEDATAFMESQIL